MIPLNLPPLRERPEDIELLARYFVERFSVKSRGVAQTLGPDFIDRLREHDWPGNVRELGNFMRRVCSLHPGVLLNSECFEQEFQPRARQVSMTLASPPKVNAGAPIRDLERAHLESTLEMTRGNRTQAAAMLGISIRTMRNRIREYGLPPRSYA